MSEHRFSDSKVSIEGASCGVLELGVTYEQWQGHIEGWSEDDLSVEIRREDLKAMAKALGMTAEDFE